jgi:Domain of unknown function (DUF4281)
MMANGLQRGNTVSLEFIFMACQGFALIGWLALAFSPINRAYCVPFARGVALMLAVAYLAQLLFNMEQVDGGSFTTIDGITTLFSAAPNVMLGWTHYLVFDLFIGSWEVEDGAERGIPHWLLLPCLGLTLMFGPVGLLLYFVVRTVWKQARQAA